MSFFLQGAFSDSYNCLTRDGQNRLAFKSYIEQAWEQYKPFCGDLGFQTQASIDFNGASWNLYVAKTLIDLGFNLQKSDSAGPDIYIKHEGKTIWLECIAVNNGPDAVPVSPVGQGFSPAEERIILRHTSGLREKCRRQFPKGPFQSISRSSRDRY